MNHLALAVAEGERRLGHDALVVDASDQGPWRDSAHVDADVHVIHSRFAQFAYAHIRDVMGREPTTVFMAHGIPEHNIELSVKEFASASGQLSPVDYWGIHRYWLKEADAFVVFNQRQQAIYQTMVPKSRVIDCVPLGVDKEFWAGGAPMEHLPGKPAVWMSENQHRIKWALDVILAWPFVAKAIPEVHLHAHFIPYDLHRFLIDLANTNGASYNMTMSSQYWPHETLRSIWKGCDFMLATTRYGDNTNLTMQAEAAGLKTISYPGNYYASYWIPEGDQRMMADELTAILFGFVEPRVKNPVPSLEDMARATIAVYERVAS